MKYKIKKIIGASIFMLLMLLFSPFLMCYFTLMVFLSPILIPIEYYLYKKKYSIFGEYHPLIMKKKRLQRLTLDYINKNNFDFIYDKEFDCFIIDKKLILFTKRTNSELNEKYQNLVDEKIYITKKQDIIFGSKD